MTEDNRPIVDPSTGEIIEGWTAHPAADLFPMAQADELDGLTADIAEHGLVEAIWTFDDGVVLDGRNRLVACRRLGLTPTVKRYRGDDPITFAVSLNLHRRHLEKSQIAAIARESVPLYAEEGRQRQAEAGKTFGRGTGGKLVADLPQAIDEKRAPLARDRAAEAFGVSGRLVGQVDRIAEQAPDLIPEIKAGTLTANAAEKILKERLGAPARLRNAIETEAMFRADAAERAREAAKQPGDHELRALLGVLQAADDQINAINHDLVKTATDERAWKVHARLIAKLETTINKKKEIQK
jgi:hypothetical protein